MKKQRQYHDLDYKRRIVQEYLAGKVTAEELAKREGLVRGQIYKWRVQLENRDRQARISEIADTEGVSLEQARRIRELEEELTATREKLAQAVLEVDLLKKALRGLVWVKICAATRFEPGKQGTQTILRSPGDLA